MFAYEALFVAAQMLIKNPKKNYRSGRDVLQM